MRCYPVSSRINQVANDDESCAAPAELPITSRIVLTLTMKKIDVATIEAARRG